ncbi:hypothetical protein [Variovorax sp. KK3]|uniref:hypothetical protein n=1 Tax=Variovorax sp. KK3 TaxID=1855728 RepID=UPI0011804C7B|nr:hypothetical protein [Variovorax sp. KK3]
MEPIVPGFAAIPSNLPALAIADHLEETLKDLPKILQQAQPALLAGTSLGELRGLESADRDALYEAACELCDADRFREALPIALQLVAHEPRDARFTFIAGSCLQRLELSKPASAMFGLCIMETFDPVALYRLGECLDAQGESRQAREAFEAVQEMCRGDHERRELQVWCTEALGRLSASEISH